MKKACATSGSSAATQLPPVPGDRSEPISGNDRTHIVDAVDERGNAGDDEEDVTIHTKLVSSHVFLYLPALQRM